LFPQGFQSFYVRVTVHSDTDDIGSSLLQNLNLPSGGFQVLGLGCGHALNSYWSITTDV
jgi:methanogenic corrinoid protein MtbC1